MNPSNWPPVVLVVLLAVLLGTYAWLATVGSNWRYHSAASRRIWGAVLLTVVNLALVGGLGYIFAILAEPQGIPAILGFAGASAIATICTWQRMEHAYDKANPDDGT